MGRGPIAFENEWFENSLGEIVIEVLKETHPCTKSSRYGE